MPSIQHIDLPLISLFSGAGGLDLGFAQEGFRTILACDNFPAAINSFNQNVSGNIAVDIDLLKVQYAQFMKLVATKTSDARPVGVIGGPPCQGFSYGNVHADPSDPRNALPFRFAKILGLLNKSIGVDFFVFENVVGLLSAKHQKRFEKICREFGKAGFNVSTQILNAINFGVPQVRRRLFIVGLNAQRYPNQTFQFPVGADHSLTVRDAISHLPEPTFFTRLLSSEDIPYHPNHWTMMPRSAKFHSSDFGAGRSFRRLNWDAPSPTVAYGNREIHVHPNGTRRLSVLEAMLLQGFPESFQLQGFLSHQVTQVSNAVPPPIARALARKLKEAIVARLTQRVQSLLISQNQPVNSLGFAL